MLARALAGTNLLRDIDQIIAYTLELEHIIPAVAVRQFVLSLPQSLALPPRYDHERCVAVLAIFIRALLGFYRNVLL
jgi:hypothetical protein